MWGELADASGKVGASGVPKPMTANMNSELNPNQGTSNLLVIITMTEMKGNKLAVVPITCTVFSKS